MNTPPESAHPHDLTAEVEGAMLANHGLEQWAPFPDELDAMVKALRYRPNWTFTLEDIQRDKDHGRGSAGGLTFIVTTSGLNAYHPERGPYYGVMHYFPVPGATYDERSWRRWLLDQIVKVETHEACEFFHLVTRDESMVGCDGAPVEKVEHPYAPTHGPGNDPYTIRELSTDLDVRTSFRGTVNEDI